MNARIVSLPDEPETETFRIQRIVDWWNELRVTDETGATTWEELGEFERQVTDCLAMRPRDISRAESLTANAMLLIAGLTDL
jgi:hypothetical protein